MESANSQRAWAKIKLSLDTAGPAKSIRQCKDKIRNLKDTYIQTKGNNKKSGSAPQTSVYFDNFDQVLGTRDGISSKNITQAGFEEELLLSDWDKMNHQKTISAMKHLVPVNRIWRINQEIIPPRVQVGILKHKGT